MTFRDCLRCGLPLDAPDGDRNAGPIPLKCAGCGQRRDFFLGPMVAITGCPGVGKSVAGAALASRFERGVVMDVDLTERREYASSSELILAWFSEWLRVGIAVAQGERFLALTGFCRPEELESRDERAWLSEIVHVALVCDADELVARLARRWVSRDWPEAEVAGLLAINEELRRIALQDPRVSLLDTTAMSRTQVVEEIAGVVRERVAWAR